MKQEYELDLNNKNNESDCSYNSSSISEEQSSKSNNEQEDYIFYEYVDYSEDLYKLEKKKSTPFVTSRSNKVLNKIISVNNR